MSVWALRCIVCGSLPVVMQELIDKREGCFCGQHQGHAGWVRCAQDEVARRLHASAP